MYMYIRYADEVFCCRNEITSLVIVVGRKRAYNYPSGVHHKKRKIHAEKTAVEGWGGLGGKATCGKYI